MVIPNFVRQALLASPSRCTATARKNDRLRSWRRGPRAVALSREPRAICVFNIGNTQETDPRAGEEGERHAAVEIAHPLRPGLQAGFEDASGVPDLSKIHVGGYAPTLDSTTSSPGSSKISAPSSV
jgi:hypothetical protein